MDTDTNEARKVEAKGGIAKVSWRGHEFEVSTEYDDWSVDFLESLEEGKAVGIVRGALGPKQWQIVKGHSINVRELSTLADAVAAAMGFGSTGESAASSD